MAILSIQSQVLNGSVGNTAAAFIYARLGLEVWPLPSVILSHHPGHGGSEGGPVKQARLAALVTGLAARGAFARCEAVVSGYLGAETAVPVVTDAIARARASHPGALYLCDPVLGDSGRIYVPHALVEATRTHLLPRADIATPNPFELEILTGLPVPDRAHAFRAMAKLGPGLVILTGFTGTDTTPDTLDILMLEAGNPHRHTVEALPRPFSGAGDAFTALFLAAYLPHRNAGRALTAAATASAALLAATASGGHDELAIVPAQHLWTTAFAAATATET